MFVTTLDPNLVSPDLSNSLGFSDRNATACALSTLEKPFKISRIWKPGFHQICEKPMLILLEVSHNKQTTCFST